MNAPSSVPSRQPGDTRRWKPTPLIAGTAALHAGAAAAVVAQPAAWPWAVGGVVASHLALTAAGLWPRSALLGPNWTRLPAHAGRRIALTIDDGPDPDVTPRVLDLLDRYDARDVLLHRRSRAPSSALDRGDRRARSRDRKPQPAAPSHVLSVGARCTAARGRGRAADADRDRRHAPAVLPGAGRPAQSVSRAGAVRTRPAAGELDAARLRHTRTRCGDRHAPPAARPRRTRHPARARRSRSARRARRTGRARRAASGAARGRRCAIALDHAARGARAGAARRAGRARPVRPPV